MTDTIVSRSVTAPATEASPHANGRFFVRSDHGRYGVLSLMVWWLLTNLTIKIYIANVVEDAGGGVQDHGSNGNDGGLGAERLEGHVRGVCGHRKRPY